MTKTGRTFSLAVALCALAAGASTESHARIARIVIDEGFVAAVSKAAARAVAEGFLLQENAAALIGAARAGAVLK